MLFFSTVSGQQQVFLNYGFDQVDFSGDEDDGVINVVVIKENENLGDFVLTLSKFTIEEFDNSGLMLPEELVDDRPDPAEGKVFQMISEPGRLRRSPAPSREGNCTICLSSNLAL